MEHDNPYKFKSCASQSIPFILMIWLEYIKVGHIAHFYITFQHLDRWL